MGMKIYESSGSFTPTDFGLKSGDTLDIICVGGGSSGVTYTSTVDSPSVAGTASSFGSAVSSSTGVVMAKGGIADGLVSGGGGGGYLPGICGYGGNGGSGEGDTLCGMGGGYKGTCVSPWANPRGPGNKGAGGGFSDYHAPGGNGYGAGGGGYGNSAGGYDGGDAGKISFGSVKLASTSAIAVTVGSGGINAERGSISGAPGVVIVFW